MSDNRLLYLNGLRGILAVIVFIHHFLFAFCPDLVFGGNYPDFASGKITASFWIAYTPLNALFNPGMAINFFFLLSGYVQSHQYFLNEDVAFLQKSFIRRYFRLALPVLVTVLLVFIFHRLHWIYKYNMPHNQLTSEWVKGMMPDNLGFLQVLKYAIADCFNGDTRYYQVLWTMSPELYNSWMVMILLMVTHGTHNRIPLLVLWMIFQALILQSFYSLAFTLGLLLCQLHHQSARFKQLFSIPVLKWVCFLAGVYFASFPFTGYEGSTSRSMYSLLSFFDKFPHVVSYLFGNLLLFIVLLHSNTLQKLLSKRTLLFLGNVSFMFYLLHFLILFSFSAWLYQQLMPLLVSAANLVVTGIASFGLIALTSYLLTRYMDAPAVRFVKLKTDRLFANEN